MHFWLCFLSLFFLLTPAGAQTFEADPPVLEQEVYFELANEAIINFNNLGADILQLRWKLLSADFPAEWDVALCDYGLCYEGIPLSGLMNPAPSSEKPFLKLVILPDQHPGALLNLGHMPQGIYTMRITNQEGASTTKLSVVR